MPANPSGDRIVAAPAAVPPAGVEYSLRAAGVEDVPRLVPLLQQAVALQQRLAGYYTLEPDFDWTAFAQRQVTQPQRTVFLAEQQKQLMGFIAVRITGYAGRRAASSLLRRRWRGRTVQAALPLQPLAWGMIEECFVTESQRRRGIGAALVAHALSWCTAQGVPRVELGVLANNPDAIAFWHKCGFQPLRVVMHQPLRAPVHT